MRRNILVIWIIFIFILLIITQLAIAYNVRTTNNEILVKNYNYNSYLYSEFYNWYNIDEISYYSAHRSSSVSYDSKNIKSEKKSNPIQLSQLYGGPMDSPWPVYCHDVRHTGRSHYSSVNTSCVEKWKFKTSFSFIGGPTIDDQGTIYVGTYDLLAIHPNGTLKWSFDTDGWCERTCPAIDENGTIYIGTVSPDEKYLYAINPDGTMKWRYGVSGVYSSPAIANDGTIIFTDTDNWYIKALYPNGTLKWAYKTAHVIYSSPAIGDDGTVYCGSHDTYLYALYPNNGTLRWKYKTGHWIRTSPCIADDGTIYVVSLDNHLHAVNPNGTMKWKTNMGEGGTSPTIGQDGTIYCGYSKLHAVNPTNGSIKWTLPIDGKIRGATPCNSIDGTIYLGNSDGSDIVAVNPDGTEKWRKFIGGDVESAPAIGKDGTVYIGDGRDDGYLHAFGEIDSDAPTAPMINGKTSGKTGKEYEYMFKSISPLGRDIYYYIEWGDGSKKDWFGPFISGEVVKASYTWSNQGTYTIRARAKDTDNLWGPWGEFEVSMSRDKAVVNSQLSELMSNIYFSRSLNQFIMAGFQL